MSLTDKFRVLINYADLDVKDELRLASIDYIGTWQENTKRFLYHGKFLFLRFNRLQCAYSCEIVSQMMFIARIELYLFLYNQFVLVNKKDSLNLIIELKQYKNNLEYLEIGNQYTLNLFAEFLRNNENYLKMYTL